MKASWLPFSPRPKPFRSKDFARRQKYRGDYLRLAGFLTEALDFESVFDVGCGNAFLLEGLAKAGKQVAGIELAPAALDVIPADLAQQVTIGDFSTARAGVELACCVEVAEHIAPDRSRELVETLSRLASRWIYFTAAPPGQPGRGHINCREPTEWLSWFAEVGWQPDASRTSDLRRRLEKLTEAPWLAGNSVVLRPAG